MITGWSLSTGTLLWLLYGLFKVELSQLAAAAFSSLSHTAWAASLAWVIIACSTGNGGFLNKMLSATWWYPFSRVTYCAYLVHPLVIRAFVLNSDSPIHMGKDTMVNKQMKILLQQLLQSKTFLYSTVDHILWTNIGIIHGSLLSVTFI